MTPPVTVFDCMVYLQAAARAEGPARACLQLAKDGQILLRLSPAVLMELEDVLNRPRIRVKFPSLTLEAVALCFEDVARVGESEGKVANVVPLPRDPKDEPYLNLAVAARADFLVSWDKDLLDLMRVDSPEG